MSSVSPSLANRFKSVGRQGVIYGLGAISEKLSGIILIPLYTQMLTATDYGALGLTATTGQIAGILFGFGLTSGMFRSYHDYDSEEEKRVVISTTFFVTIVSGLCLLITGLLSSRFWAQILLDDAVYWPYFAIVFVSTFLGLVGQITFTVFRLRDQAVKYSVLSFLSFLIEVGCIIYLVVYLEWGILGILVGRLIAAVIITLALLYFLQPLLVLQISKEEIRKMMSYGVPLAFAGLAGFVFNYIDRYFLKYYLDLNQVGIYTLGYQFGMLITVLVITPTKLVWGPAFLAAKDAPHFKEFCAKALTYLLLLSAFIFLLLTTLSKEVIQIMASPDYWTAYRLVPFVTFAYFVWSTRSVVEVGISLARRTKVTATYFIVGAILNVLLNLLLIPAYGTIGAAYATLGAFCFMVIINYIYNQRLFYIPYEWKRIGKITVAIAAVLVATSFVQISNVWLAIVVKSFLLFLYPLVLWLLQFPTPQEWKQLHLLLLKFRKTKRMPI